MKNPCYRAGEDCPQRAVGCHGKCAAWAEYRRAHEAEQAARSREREEKAVVADYMRRAARSYEKKRR